MSNQETQRTLVADEAGQRLDIWLSECFAELSRSAVKRLVQQGRITVDGKTVKAGYKLRVGETVVVDLPATVAAGSTAPPVARASELDIVYEDEHILAINKAAGVVVHPAPGHEDDTVVNALLALRPDIRAANVDPQRPGIVHRLDRDTTGLLLVAKTRAAQDVLLDQFRARTVDKLYLTLAHGRFTPDRGAIDAPIGRSPKDRQRMAVVEGGRHARTEYTALDNASGVSLVACKLITGRTHQIRVHLAAIGHPVVGDPVYGGANQPPKVPRQMLHAWRVGLVHPVTGNPLDLGAPPPSDMVDLARRLELDWDASLTLATNLS